jgi:hypothetical protein
MGRVYGKKKTGASRKPNRKLRRRMASSSPFKRKAGKKRALLSLVFYNVKKIGPDPRYLAPDIFA